MTRCGHRGKCVSFIWTVRFLLQGSLGWINGFEMNASAHLSALLSLGIPLIGSFLAGFLLGLTDTIMLGWYSVEALAAATIAGSFFMTLQVVGSGFAWAVTSLVAEADARSDTVQVRRATRMGMWLSVAFAGAVMPALWFSEGWLIGLGQTPEVALGAQTYLRIAGWGLFPALLVRVLASYLSAVDRAGPVLWVTLFGAAINVVFNYALIFGNLGLPELGIQGAAIASVLVQVAMLAVFMGYAQKVLPQYDLFRSLWKIDASALRQVFALGWPIALTSLAETSLFTAASTMMGWLGTDALAAHGIALQVATGTFMVHLGLSQATTVRAGNAVGRRDAAGLILGGKIAVGTSFAFSAATMVVFFGVPDLFVIAFLDPDDPARDVIIPIGVSLIYMAALFQFADGLQVICLGLLRGVQDTRVPMWLAALSYWGLGLPAAYILGFVLDFGGVGVWAGLIVGLLGAAVLLVWRFTARRDIYITA